MIRALRSFRDRLVFLVPGADWTRRRIKKNNHEYCVINMTAGIKKKAMMTTTVYLSKKKRYQGKEGILLKLSDEDIVI